MEFLSLDHANGNGNKHRASIGGRNEKVYRWIVKNSFLGVYTKFMKEPREFESRNYKRL